MQLGGISMSCDKLKSAAESVNLPAKEEEEQKADDDDSEDDPSHPRIPCGLLIASAYTVAIVITPGCRHSISELCRQCC